MNSFCRKKVRLEALIKVTLKADTVDGKREKKVLQKLISNLFFSIMSLLTLLSANKNNSSSTLRLYTNDALSLILFQPITAWLFPIAAPFPTLFILTIPLDKCETKTYKNTNILINVKLFC